MLAGFLLVPPSRKPTGSAFLNNRRCGKERAVKQVNVTEATEDQLDLRAAGASTNGQPTDQTQAGNMVVVSDLPAEDIQHLVQAFRKGGMVIEQDVPAITNTPFRAQVRGQFVPFTVRDAAAIEQVTGEPLCVIPHVIPFAMPLSVAMTKIADLHWKSAVQDGRTTLGLQDWKRQYLLEHKVSRIIQLVEQQQG